MVGVLLAADGDAPVPAPNPVAWAVRSGQHEADVADLITGALRIRGRMALNRVRRTRWLSWTVRDERWSDALAVVSVIAPLLLLVAALTEFHIPQAVASSITGHPHWGVSASLGLADLPMAVGAAGVTVLVFLQLRRLAGLGALATATGADRRGRRTGLRRVREPGGGVHRPALLHRRGSAAPLPGPGRGLALLTRSGTALVGAGALILGGFSVGGDVWFGPLDDGAPPRFDHFGGKVAGLPADLVIGAVLVAVRGRLPARPGPPARPRAAGHPGDPVCVLVAGKTRHRPVRPAGRRLGDHPVLYPPALPAAAAAGEPHPRRDLARPAPGGRAGSSDALRDLRTPERRERLTRDVVVVAPATAVAGAATTTPAIRARPSGPAHFAAKSTRAASFPHSRKLPPTSVREENIFRTGGARDRAGRIRSVGRCSNHPGAY